MAKGGENMKLTNSVQCLSRECLEALVLLLYILHDMALLHKDRFMLIVKEKTNYYIHIKSKFKYMFSCNLYE
jgi:hypothetical protein